MCKYMDDCNGNGDCNSYGKCECNTGFYGADCSSTATDLTTVDGNTQSESVTGNRWFYYVLPEDIGDVTLNVTSDRAV